LKYGLANNQQDEFAHADNMAREEAGIHVVALENGVSR
jgi:hypothetical protein